MSDVTENKDESKTKLPANFAQSLLFLVWDSRYRWLYVLGALLCLGALTVWTSLPEKIQLDILGKGQQEDRVGEGSRHSAGEGEGTEFKLVENQEVLPVDPRLFKMIKQDEMLGTASIVPLAQLNKTNFACLIIWPALTPEGSIIDNNAWAITFKRGRGFTTIVKKDKIFGKIEDHVRKDFGEYRLYDRKAGTNLSEIGPFLEKHSKAFKDGLNSGDFASAVAAATRFSRLFSFSILNNPMTKILIRVSDHGPLEYVRTESAEGKTFVLMQIKLSPESIRLSFEVQSDPNEQDNWTISSITGT